MTEFLEKHRKTLFYLILIGCVITIGIYNFLTPYFTDDYGYAQEARSAGSLWGLIKQQYIEYMYHNARIIGQFNLRLFLIPGKWLFNIMNSLMFTGLVLLIYAMIHGKKKYDLFVLFLVITFVWRYSVAVRHLQLFVGNGDYHGIPGLVPPYAVSGQAGAASSGDGNRRLLVWTCGRMV